MVSGQHETTSCRAQAGKQGTGFGYGDKLRRGERTPQHTTRPSPVKPARRAQALQERDEMSGLAKIHPRAQTHHRTGR
jgi:hypothetical protein